MWLSISLHNSFFIVVSLATTSFRLALRCCLFITIHRFQARRLRSLSVIVPSWDDVHVMELDRFNDV